MMTLNTPSPHRRITTRALALCSVALLFANVIACGERGSDGPDIRGNGLRAAAVDDQARALVYDAALRQAFDVDSALVLLIDPAILPRNGTFARDTKLPPGVVSALQRAGTTRGTCEAVDDGRRAPQCAAAGPGYVVRFSDIYQARGDTVRVFLAAQRFRTTTGIGPAQRFVFESGFEIVRRGANAWRVAREGRRVDK
jgi:hypothetical protein